MHWDVGDTLVTKVTVTNIDGVAVDPTSISLDWRWSDQIELTTWTYGADPEVSREDVGVYTAQIPLERSGVLLFGWRSTNPTSAEQRRITVNPWYPASP